MLTVSRAVTIDLGDHTISADETFPKGGEDNKNHLVDVTADGVTITNGTLTAGANNNHTLNIWNADGVQLYKLTLDNTASYGGAPLVIGSSDVTIGLADSNDDTVTVVAGQNSWYGINLDSRDLEDNAAYLKVQGKLLFQGVQKSVGIYVENNYGDSADDVTLELADGTSFTNEGSNVDEYVGINAAPKDSGFGRCDPEGVGYDPRRCSGRSGPERPKILRYGERGAGRRGQNGRYGPAAGGFCRASERPGGNKSYAGTGWSYPDADEQKHYG